jgi:hypothetical protein
MSECMLFAKWIIGFIFKCNKCSEEVEKEKKIIM